MRTTRIILLAMLASASVFASAQRMMVRETQAPKVVYPVSVQRCDSAGRPVGPVIPYQAPSGPGAALADHRMIFDSTNSDPALIPAAGFFGSYYGANAGNFRAANTYKNFNWLGDIGATNPANPSRSAKLFEIGVVWNPGGGATRSGSGPLSVIVNFTNYFNMDSNGLPVAAGVMDGVILNYSATLAAGFYALSADLATASFSVPTPQTSGACLIQLRGRDLSNNLIFLGGTTAAQPILKSMCSPGETFFPGTNPCTSSILQWDDDTDDVTGPAINTPDNAFQTLQNATYAELYDYTGDATSGDLNAAVGAFSSTNFEVAQGTVSFQGVDQINAMFKVWTVTVEIRTPGTAPDNGTPALSTQTVSVNSATGAYEIHRPSTLAPGTYDISLISSHFLRRTLPNALTITGVAGTDVIGAATLLNGNVDGFEDTVSPSTEVSIADYSFLSLAFGSFRNYPTAPDANWNELADLNHDDEVNIGDYALLSANFGAFGDD